MKEKIEKLNAKYKDFSTKALLESFLKESGGRVAFSSSFGAEDQMLTDMILKISKEVEIFTLDTGRLPQETYDVMHKTNLKYGTTIAAYFPLNENIQRLYIEQGVNGFYDSVDNRKDCCFVRKIEPLQRALDSIDVWITGLRSQQSLTREGMKLFEWDEGNKLIKLNPLISWSEKDIWHYIKENDVPYNELHKRGYPSIGCAPCTRAVEDGADIRSGRWWWESPEHKECGLHIR